MANREVARQRRARGKTLWCEVLFVVLMTTLVAAGWPAAARSLLGGSAITDSYGWDPLGIIGGSSDLRMHSVGEDLWDVWVCDTPDGSVLVTPDVVVP